MFESTPPPGTPRPATAEPALTCEPPAPGEQLAALLGSAPSAGTAVALERLGREPLSLTELVRGIEAWDRLLSWAHAQQLELIGRFASSAGVRDPAGDEDFVLPELSGALRLSPAAVQRRVMLAQSLAGPLAPTARALGAGGLTFLQALRCSETLAGRSAEVAEQVQATVLPDAAEQSLAELTRSLRRAVAVADPVTECEAHADAAAGRRVELYDQDAGMATVAATLPAPEACTVYDALTRWAMRAEQADRAAGLPGGEGPGRDARRADALVEISRLALADPGFAGRTPSRWEVGVLIELPTLLGLNDRPGELVGYGPLPANLARSLAADAAWRRLVTDPLTGELLDLGRRVYEPAQPLRDYVVARDRRCRFVHCHRPARRCDLDHVVPFEQGGETSRANLQATCRYHHLAKTAGAWSVVRHPDGSADWTGPAGIRYRVPPSRYPPER